jgi:hypothetical protein
MVCDFIKYIFSNYLIIYIGMKVDFGGLLDVEGLKLEETMERLL